MKGSLFRRLAVAMILTAPLGACQAARSARPEIVSSEVLKRHDYRLADTPNKRTALAYLYTAWNDAKVREARATYWAPGAFRDNPSAARMDGPSKPMPHPRYTIKKVVEEGKLVVVLAFVEGVGIGEPITTLFGTPGGTKIGDAVVEIFEFDNGLIVRKWDTIEPLSVASYDFE